MVHMLNGNRRVRRLLRRLRLFASASCRREVWSDFTDDNVTKAVVTAESYADGLIPFTEVDQLRNELLAPLSEVVSRRLEELLKIVSLLATDSRYETEGPLSSITRQIGGRFPNQSHVQSDLLRDIFGPLPFRPVTLDPDCLTPTVKALGEAIYQECAFDRLPILADALEENGCKQEEVLKHLRGEGEHVRGCWCSETERRQTEDSLR
jgi:hypothetical protein